MTISGMVAATIKINSRVTRKENEKKPLSHELEVLRLMISLVN
jgi:hypothetical protein